MPQDPNGGSSGPEAPGHGAPPPHPIYNWMSGFGASIVAVSVAAIVFFILLGLFTREGSGYAGLPLLLPLALAVLGLALLVGGWTREARRHKRGVHSSFFETWVVDPWATVQRIGSLTVLLLVSVGTLALLTAGAGSVALIEYTESNEFCMQACHSVMGPEAVVYEHAPHSEIPCVDCHVAPGAEGYLQAKVGGLRQLYAMITNDVSRPIPTPLHASPIGRELCEDCHAPARFSGYKAVTRSYFPSGDASLPIKMAMLVKIGDGSNGAGPAPNSGIHYHMQLARRVEYIARDAKRQDIAWVRVTEEDGDVREFEHESRPLDDDERSSLEIHTMDCVDCHSRPAHRFTSPVESVNEALASGALPADLPAIKMAAVGALDGDYETTAEALQGIESHLREFYEEEDESVLEEQSEELERTTEALRAIYRRTIFPEMEADWRAHPDNAGHLNSPGCFRCHNQELVDAEGEYIFSDCTTCHTILAQDEQTIGSMASFETGREFVHPEDWSSFEEFTFCADCHTGGAELYE